MHFFNRTSYHNYNALALSKEFQGDNIAKDLGKNNTVILRNHGTITCGSTIEEAFFYTMFLEKACKVQVLAMSATNNLIIPDNSVCKKAAADMLNFEEGNIGKRDFEAHCRTTNFPW